uniref:SWIM-type domain-containing protein n=1 Tax=Solanum lycopersicum TaxID=4081 RepID=K4CT77_SOLLC
MLVKKPRKEIKSGFVAHMVISHQPNGKFSIISFGVKHNHPLVHQSLAQLLPSQRDAKVSQAHEIDILDDLVICPKCSFEYVAHHHDVEFYKYDVSTHESCWEHALIVNHSTKVLSCTCKLFEFSYVLCGHDLKILDTLDVKDKIPNHYILER